MAPEAIRQSSRPDTTVEAVVLEAIEAIPPLSPALLWLNEHLQDPDNNTASIVEGVGVDPALAATVLRAGNSAAHGVPGRAFTLTEAVMRLGRRELRTLVTAELGRRAMSGDVPAYGLEDGSLWRSAVAGALAAREWAGRAAGRPCEPESAYLAGILRDIGKLAVAPHFPATLAEVVELPRSIDFARLEEAHAGFDHAALSAAVARRSGVADVVVDAIAHHHRPGEAGQSAALSALVHLGDATALLVGTGIGVDVGFYGLDPAAYELVPDLEAQIDAVMLTTLTELNGIEAVLGLHK